MGTQARDRNSLGVFLQQRHREGDQLTLKEFQLNTGGNFVMVLDRNGVQLDSKGAIHCASGEFIVWSIGPNPGPG